MERTPHVNTRRFAVGGYAPTLAALTLALLASALAAPTCTDALQADLEAALQAESSARWTREDDVARRRADFELARLGVTASIGLRPSIGVGHGLDFEEGVEALDLVGYQFDAALGYSYDEVRIARSQAALVGALSRLEAQRRTDVLNALVALSRLRVAERAEAAAHAELALALGGLSRAEATAAERAADPDYAPLPGSREAQDLGTRPPAEPPFLREARLQARRAELDLEDAHTSVNTQLAALAALGVTPPAPVDGACPLGPLDVPSAGPGETLARQALLVALQLAEAQLGRAAWAPVRELNLEAQYQEGGARAAASAGIAGGKPNAGVAFRLSPTGKDAWRVRLSANLRLDESMGAAIADAEAAVHRARQELAAFDEAGAAADGVARQALTRAWAEVEVLDETLQLAVIKRDDPAEARYLPRNTQAVARALDARERGLQAYFRAYAAYLGAIEVAWPSR